MLRVMRSSATVKAFSAAACRSYTPVLPNGSPIPPPICNELIKSAAQRKLSSPMWICEDLASPPPPFIGSAREESAVVVEISSNQRVKFWNVQDVTLPHNVDFFSFTLPSDRRATLKYVKNLLGGKFSADYSEPLLAAMRQRKLLSLGWISDREIALLDWKLKPSAQPVASKGKLSESLTYINCEDIETPIDFSKYVAVDRRMFDVEGRFLRSLAVIAWHQHLDASGAPLTPHEGLPLSQNIVGSIAEFRTATGCTALELLPDAKPFMSFSPTSGVFYARALASQTTHPQEVVKAVRSLRQQHQHRGASFASVSSVEPPRRL